MTMEDMTPVDARMDHPEQKPGESIKTYKVRLYMCYKRDLKQQFANLQAKFQTAKANMTEALNDSLNGQVNRINDECSAEIKQYKQKIESECAAEIELYKQEMEAELSKQVAKVKEDCVAEMEAYKMLSAQNSAQLERELKLQIQAKATFDIASALQSANADAEAFYKSDNKELQEKLADAQHENHVLKKTIATMKYSHEMQLQQQEVSWSREEETFRRAYAAKAREQWVELDKAASRATSKRRSAEIEHGQQLKKKK